MEDNQPPKIKVYGFELVLIGIVGFVSIIALTVLAYKIFIIQRVKNSVEYNTATYFVANSETLKEQLLSELVSMKFTDLEVNEKDNYGICEIKFDLILKNKLVEKLRVGLVKVADYWVVYTAELSPDTPSQYNLVSTYQKIVTLINMLSYQDVKTAQYILQLIKAETRDANLYDYVSARVNAMAGNDTYAAQILDDLKDRVDYSRMAVLYERAMIHFSAQEYTKAIAVFEVIIDENRKETNQSYQDRQTSSIFSGLPKDPFIASFSHDTILAQVYQNLALAYSETGEFQKGLDTAEQALEKSAEIGSKTIYSTSLFVKALNLYKLKLYKEADKGFGEVIADIDNGNLSQKAWAYFYKADIANRFGKDQYSLDYYETAVGLDPFNNLIRKGAVEYLLRRNFAGDLEIALGMALRGIQYGVDKESFKAMATQIYSRLGLKDKTAAVN